MYVPLGLNYFDANIGNSKAKLPSLPGIKIYHVDARLAYFSRLSSGLEFIEYCDVPYKADPSTSIKNINIAHDNSTPQTVTEISGYKQNYLYELELNNVGHPEAACATNVNLFHKGDSYTIKASKFNKESNTFYKISVKSLSYTSATLKIEKTN